MKKKLKRLREINEELGKLASVARSENRSFTDAEKAQLESYEREKQWLQVEINTINMAREEETQTSPLVSFVREAANGRTAVTHVIRAAGDMATSDLSSLQPLTIGDIVEKVEEQLIWDKIGVQMPTGLAGRYEWPVVGDLEATFAGEGVAVTPNKVDISKVSAVQNRAAITSALTRESIFNSEGRLMDVVFKAAPKAIAKAINKVVCSPTQISGINVAGPFVTATKKTVPFTFAGLNKAKAELLKLGYENDSLVWVMSEETKAELECTAKDAGSGLFVIENNMLCGRPVFCSSHMGAQIGIGDFRFQVVGQFGNPELIVDPYTRAKEGKVEVTLNADYGTATLDAKAFMLLTKQTV